MTPVNGVNLESIITHHKDVRKAVKNILEPFFRIVFKQGSNELSFQKDIYGDDDDVDRVVEFSLSQISDTLLRMIFYYAAITSNKDSVIVFEEPETKSFPFHVKMLAENIALDENKNQFFIATHNPYMVLSLLEKTPAEEINIIITHMNKKGETQIHIMKPDEISETLDDPYEIFFNFNRFIDKD